MHRYTGEAHAGHLSSVIGLYISFYIPPKSHAPPSSVRSLSRRQVDSLERKPLFVRTRSVRDGVRGREGLRGDAVWAAGQATDGVLPGGGSWRK